MVRSRESGVSNHQGMSLILRDAADAAPQDEAHIFQPDSLSRVTIARHNGAMDIAPRLDLMNWLTGQGLTGASENDLVRGFCERCRAGGLDVSRGIVFIDT